MERLKEIRINLVKQGRSLTDVAREMGINRSSLYYYINQKELNPEIKRKLQEQKLLK